MKLNAAAHGEPARIRTLIPMDVEAQVAVMLNRKIDVPHWEDGCYAFELHPPKLPSDCAVRPVRAVAVEVGGIVGDVAVSGGRVGIRGGG